MSAFPSLPLFTDAYIADTAHLTNEEHGAYLRLLMFAWRSPGCQIANDDVRIARMLGLTARRWAGIKPGVMAFWTLINGNWTQKRLAREHAFVSGIVEKKRSAGRLGGRPKSLKNNNAAEASGSELEKQNESIPKAPTPTPILTPVIPTGIEPIGFAEFRSVYPRRNVAFPTTLARKRWMEATKRGATSEAIIAGAKAYASEQERIGKAGTEFVKTADAWLNQQRWNDYQPDESGEGGSGQPTDPRAYLARLSDEDWRRYMQRWKATGGQ